MKHMKKVAASLLTLAMTTSLAACSPAESTAPAGSDAPGGESTVWVPEGDITIRVPSAAGGGLDTYARIFAEGLKATYDVNVIVTNLAGANGTIAAADLNSVEASAHELMMGNIGQFATAPQFTPETSLKIEDYTFLGSVLSEDQVLYVAPGNTGIESYEDLVAYGQANGLIVGSQPPGNAPAAVMTAALGANDIEFTSIYSEGGNIDIVSLVAGDVDLSIGYPSVGIQYYEEGSVIPILSFGEEPCTLFEGLEIPTASSVGLDLVFTSNNFVFAKKGADAEALNQMYESFVAWQETDEFKELAETSNYIPFYQTADDLTQALIDAEAMFEEIYATYYADTQ